jgi:RimJ/RimL family protein N-acetyltransferase
VIWWPTEIPTLFYGNISLRPSREEDIQQIYEACQDPIIPRFTTVPSPYELSHAESFIRELAPKRFLEKKELLFVISSNQVIANGFCGVISFHTTNIGNHSTEVGYWLAAPARQRGIGTAAVRLITNYGIATMGFRRIEALVDIDNTASQALLKSAGYDLEGILKQRVTRANGNQIDMALFAKVNE